jgi:hypothetical protein
MVYGDLSDSSNADSYLHLADLLEQCAKKLADENYRRFLELQVEKNALLSLP